MRGISEFLAFRLSSTSDLHAVNRGCQTASLLHPITILLMIALTLTPLIAAAGYSLVYLLAGGGLGGALLIFIVAKMFRK